ncbi:hypothetical protein CHE218_05360 [Microbacterium sp. che218]
MSPRIGPCLANHAWHDFDPLSGWCSRGCGRRDDGAVSYPATPLPPLEAFDITEPRRHPNE